MLDEFIQYELVIPDQPRNKPQPRCILLESQLESLKHHFVHWNLSGPTPSVTCQVSKRYCGWLNDFCLILAIAKI